MDNTQDAEIIKQKALSFFNSLSKEQQQDFLKDAAELLKLELAEVEKNLQ